MKYDPGFIERLRLRLQQPLPGLDAQMRMAPPVRGREYVIPPNARRSAVLALLYPCQDQYYLAFMKRAEDGRVHSGQVCFPGGRREKEDTDYTFTALRETEEELGVPASKVAVLGPLTELYIPPSNSLVYPRVGYYPGRPQFKPDQKEVAQVLEVPLGHFLKQEVVGRHRVDVHAGNYIEAPGYTVGEHLIWGATAMIIAELMHLVREIRN
ncbi:MAG: CoA pyrophosphatase [Bacteroidetes bacterium]|nr:MAG: CoA pyrophosphatase [Bacteroidota bacterium]